MFIFFVLGCRTQALISAPCPILCAMPTLIADRCLFLHPPRDPDPTREEQELEAHRGIFCCPRTFPHPKLHENPALFACRSIKKGVPLLQVPIPSNASEQVNHSQNPESSTPDLTRLKGSFQKTLKNFEPGPSSALNSNYWRSGLLKEGKAWLS